MKSTTVCKHKSHKTLQIQLIPDSQLSGFESGDLWRANRAMYIVHVFINVMIDSILSKRTYTQGILDAQRRSVSLT